MARVLITSFGSYGDVNPFIGLALALRDRGHAPVVAMPSCYRSAVEREGLSFRAVRPDVDIHDRGFAARIMDPARGTEVTFGEVILPSLEDTVADLGAAAAGADLVVTHPAALAGPIVADLHDLPWVSTVLAPMSFFSIHDPVVPAPAPWIHALTSRSRPASRLFRRLTERMTRRWAEPVQRFRASLGLEPGGNPILDGQHSPFRVLGLFSCVLGSPQPDWPPGVRVTGPVLYNGPGVPSLSDELARFLDAGDAPLVFTLGTSAVGAAGSFYDISAAVARRLGRRAVLLAGRHSENRPTIESDDVFVTDFARHDALFPRAAAVVHQGGAGTLHQALRAGRPMLVVPYAHDQPDNAHRAERLGVARTLPPGRYRPERLERELRALLGHASYAERAASVATVVAQEPGAAAAAAEIEGVLSRHDRT